MTIRDADAYMRGVWDWGMLRGCFGDTRIEPSDLDGIVDRGGQFLVLETKQPGAPIPEGQRILFENLCRTGLFTVMVIWGEQNAPVEILVMNGQSKKPYPDADSALLRSLVSRWFFWANSGAGAAAFDRLRKGAA